MFTDVSIGIIIIDHHVTTLYYNFFIMTCTLYQMKLVLVNISYLAEKKLIKINRAYVSNIVTL